jgi:hypothetical protein
MGRKMGVEPTFLWSQHKVLPLKLLPPEPLAGVEPTP